MVVASDFERAVLTRIVPVAIESIHRRVASASRARAASAMRRAARDRSRETRGDVRREVIDHASSINNRGVVFSRRSRDEV
jgi:hypothetical protein